MKKGVLIGVFALQVVIVAVVFGVKSIGTSEEAEPFLSFDQEQVTGFTVSDIDGSVALSRADAGWMVGDLPADDAKVDRVLEKLGSGRSSWPVATSESTAERFEVTEENHQRHITINQGDDVLADFYIGSSPAYRQAHARSADGGPVYSIEFSHYEAGSERDDWFNKQLLQPDGQVVSIERVGSYKLDSGEEGWVSTPSAELDEEKVTSFVDRFVNMSVYKLNEDEISVDPLAEFVVADGKGSTRFTVYNLDEESKDYVIVSDRFDAQFGLSTYVGDEIVVPLEDLAVEAAEEDVDGEVDSGASEELEVDSAD